MSRKDTICVVGLGYVGLPLAEVLSRKFPVAGFDISSMRIQELAKGLDRTGEVDKDVLLKSGIRFSDDPAVIAECSTIIITVPTPIDEHKRPDLRPVLAASWTVGRHMSPGTTVVFESTVYPGVTEEECVPIIEAESGLTWKQDFNVGYSPERVNPGDKEHTIDRITKVVAGDTPETTQRLCKLYGAVISSIHPTSSIKAAEAAKVIENTQRDLNIALMNELSIIFHRLDIDTHEVLNAAATKWNFHHFVPGLVGGHCIGVDPYYLTFKAKSIGYHPEVILAGRRINDNMGKYVAEATVKQLIKAGKKVKGAGILVLGLTFKENISDVRNSQVVRLVEELRDFGASPLVFEPHADPALVLDTYGIELLEDVNSCAPCDAIVLAVPHRRFREDFSLVRCRQLADDDSPILIDIKGVYSGSDARKAGFTYWRL